VPASKPIEKFVVVRSSRAGTGKVIAQVQRYAGSTAYYPDANAAHKAAALLGGRAAGYIVESRFIDDRGRETSLKLQAVPLDDRMVIGAH
jgi:hypothetical protein